MIHAGIIGATGYAGAELVRLLAAHENVHIDWYGSKSYTGEAFASIYRNFFTIIEDECLGDNLNELCERVDVLFTATPQGYLSQRLSKDILSHIRVIDLSADYRLKDVETYEKWYGITHGSPNLLKEAVYGLCEIHRKKIRGARLVANPGCYTTCSILSAFPLVKEGLIDPHSLIIDAKSGTSGAGRGAKTANLFCEVNENIKAYGVTTHRHTPEIEQELSAAAGEEIAISFTPHLVPMNRGILVTAYASLKDGADEQKLRDAYKKYYEDEPFIRLLPPDVCPETRWVEGSNYVDINIKVDERVNRVVIMAALDNLVKGAAGQAVQNMNILFEAEETTGLTQPPLFP